ncbi:CDK5 regulatory subunit-associated protein 1 [Chionoecetes opilio]|uniref:CDK5 regulatory subunit-associated protein 1 n=1 Tax=Chionoecetes opilio TaxID=41210 RepID=A0A8J4XVD6_CHIOP|nr:CDK5 regulatory subunit-associated protein 1 [Chionoecetes opilio]
MGGARVPHENSVPPQVPLLLAMAALLRSLLVELGCPKVPKALLGMSRTSPGPWRAPDEKLQGQETGEPSWCSCGLQVVGYKAEVISFSCMTVNHLRIVSSAPRMSYRPWHRLFSCLQQDVISSCPLGVTKKINSSARHILSQSSNHGTPRIAWHRWYSAQREGIDTSSHLQTSSSTPSDTNAHSTSRRLREGPGLEHFIANSGLPQKMLSARDLEKISHPYIALDDISGHGRKVYFDVYGCQMNVSDTEVAWSILKDHGYVRANRLETADVVLVMTCAIREGAEDKVWNKLQYLKGLKNKRWGKRRAPPMKIGVLGCMAERLKKKLVEQEKSVDVVAGPDSYRDLPRLLALVDEGEAAVNVLLSLEETYADVVPVSLTTSRMSAYISIMRGCDNMCSYCIVPFTRGKERSRDIQSILEEVRLLSDQGVKEITLLGQNVNSYRDMSQTDHQGISLPMEVRHRWSRDSKQFTSPRKVD